MSVPHRPENGVAEQPLILFGGTFDPVHIAHIRCAQAVSRALGHAPVHLLPNAVPPHRPQPGADGAHRLAMLQRACADHPALIADDRELRRDGPSYTLHTLEQFRAEAGDRPLVFMVGGDGYATLDRWRHWQRFPGLCHLAVIPRPGAPVPPAAVREAFPVTEDADTLRQSPAGRALILTHPRLDISATVVRRQLREQGHCRAVPEPVMAYIRQHGLYGIAATT